MNIELNNIHVFGFCESNTSRKCKTVEYPVCIHQTLHYL